MITNIIRPSDFEIEFQLEDENDITVDVDDITDIWVELIHIPTHLVMCTKLMVDITLDNTDDTIHVFIEDTDNENKKLGKYLLKVHWTIPNVDFDGLVMNNIDQSIIVDLYK